jgi:hypothetical protein
VHVTQMSCACLPEQQVIVSTRVGVGGVDGLASGVNGLAVGGLADGGAEDVVRILQ